MFGRSTCGLRDDARLDDSGGHSATPFVRNLRSEIQQVLDTREMTLDRREVTARGLVQTVRIRTDDGPERDRIAMFRELYGRDRIRIEPSRDEPLHIDALLLKSPDLGLLSGRRSPLRSEFTDGSDRLILNLGGPARATQFGREVLLERGDAIALSGLDRGTLTNLRSGRIMTLEVPHG